MITFAKMLMEPPPLEPPNKFPAYPVHDPVLEIKWQYYSDDTVVI